MTDTTSETVPTEPTVADLVGQIQALQERLDATQTTDPGDPVEKALVDLTAHVTAKVAQLPHTDLSELKSTVDGLLSAGEATVNQGALVKTLVEDAARTNPHHDFEYLKVLASDFHKLLLKHDA